MLQIALLLLSCGLSRYMWSINTSVACVVISFALLGILFYVGIVVAGTFSYECPFQTPGSAALRDLQSGRKIFSGLSQISQLLHIDRVFGNAEEILAERVQRYKSTQSLPLSNCGASRQPQAPQSRLLLPVRDLSARRHQNAGHARCLSWIVRCITDPDAIDCAIRLTSSIKWFDDGVEVDPPFGFIVSTFKACFAPTKNPYPGMNNRAYLCGRAILHINMSARLKSEECASKYPIPYGFFSVSGDSRELREILRLFWSTSQGVSWDHFFLNGTPTHSLWMSNLFVDMTRADPTTLTEFALSETNKMGTSRPAIDANILLAWCVHLGGYVEEETFWAVDKSWVMILSNLACADLRCCP